MGVFWEMIKESIVWVFRCKRIEYELKLFASIFESLSFPRIGTSPVIFLKINWLEAAISTVKYVVTIAYQKAWLSSCDDLARCPYGCSKYLPCITCHSLYLLFNIVTKLFTHYPFQRNQLCMVWILKKLYNMRC